MLLAPFVGGCPKFSLNIFKNIYNIMTPSTSGKFLAAMTGFSCSPNQKLEYKLYTSTLMATSISMYSLYTNILHKTPQISSTMTSNVNCEDYSQSIYLLPKRISEEQKLVILPEVCPPTGGIITLKGIIESEENSMKMLNLFFTKQSYAK